MFNRFIIIFNVSLLTVLLIWNLVQGTHGLDNARAHDFYGGYCGASSFGESDPTCSKSLAFNFYQLLISISLISFLNALFAKGAGNFTFRKSLVTGFIACVYWISLIEVLSRIIQIPVMYFTPTEGRISLLYSAYLLFFPLLLLFCLVLYLISAVTAYLLAIIIRKMRTSLTQLLG